MVIFAFAVLGIIAVFALKHREEAAGAVFMPRLRSGLDERAVKLSELLLALKLDIEKLPPELLHLSRVAVHELALALARSARYLEAQSHRLADLVSHKHRFQRREAPRSEFLKKVIEHKNGNGETTDADL